MGSSGRGSPGHGAWTNLDRPCPGTAPAGASGQHASIGGCTKKAGSCRRRRAGVLTNDARPCLLCFGFFLFLYTHSTLTPRACAPVRSPSPDVPDLPVAAAYNPLHCVWIGLCLGWAFGVQSDCNPECFRPHGQASQTTKGQGADGATADRGAGRGGRARARRAPRPSTRGPGGRLGEHARPQPRPTARRGEAASHHARAAR